MSEENTLTNEAENYIVTARKWRPLTFADVVGQDHITQTLKNAVTSGRMHHAYLFCGPRGVGKTTTARIMARAVNCLNPIDAEPCNKCINCQAVLEGRSVDVIEIDGASNNSVDDIRKLRENAKYPPSHGKYKMYVIDEVHMLSSAAFNALLKTLEEPPPHLMFVFATTEAHKVLPTITSRCQRYDFRRMETGEIVSQLKYIAGKESITIDEKSLMIIAKRADGSMRDSQSIFDQVIAFCGKNVDFHATVDSLSLIDDEFYFRISRAAVSKDTAEMFHIANEIINRGYDLQETLSGLLEHLRHLLTVVVTGSTELIETASEIQKLYQQESKNFRKNDLLRMMNLIAQSEQEIRFAKQPRVKFELTLCKLATMDTVAEIEDLIRQINGLPTTESPVAVAPSPKAVPENIIARENNPTYSPEKKTPDVKEVKVEAAKIVYELPKDWDKILKSDEINESGLSKGLEHAEMMIAGKVLVLKYNNAFHADFIGGKGKLLESILSKNFDLNFSVKVELELPTIEPNDNNLSSDSTSNNKYVDQSKDLHPFENEIINIFGATEVRND
ncbi:MAG: DNA polymerase III subunit gamma/tau [Ignavibacteriae bacterium HGW-Ignavibacteriae-1]|jgi:DNA polymerase-3 subunit gamma/tau|nr:MAG: DNA polymerase III subunit gamma/tau [Ignavibacteriae bacterium HGW-Ignavibacteriae-1]